VSASDAISPTAHYTGYVWARHGISHPALETREGRLLFESMRPMNAISEALGGVSLETYLLTRHRAIDVLLERAVEDGGVSQVVEVAIITEGLLGYLPGEAVDGIWRRFADTLSAFARGRYISDLHLAAVQNAQVRIFRVLLSGFVRGRVYLHFDDTADAEVALLRAGFASATLHRAAALAPEIRGRGSTLAHILEASIK
jgi:O-methyltransferase involved in polyketide biosynthesis